MVKLTKHKLGDLIEVTRGASLSGEYYAEEGRLVRLTLGNFDMNANGFKLNTSKTDLFFNGPMKPEFILNEGDIITPLTEQSLGLLGTTAKVPESGKYIQSQDVALVKCKDGVDPDFIYYLLPSKIVRSQLSAAAQQTKIRHTSPDKIKDCTVWVTAYAEQVKIGKLLSSLDRKIAHNKAINHNLEAMARQLYDYWFVQFDFPDENGKPYKSSGGKLVWKKKLKRNIPESWSVKNLFNAVDVRYGFPFSTELFSEEKTSVPVVRIRDILEGTISAYSQEPTDEKYQLAKGDVVIGMDGNFHMNFWHDNNSYLNQRCVRLRPSESSAISSMQLLYEIHPYIKAKEAQAKGSTVGHLSDKDLKALYVLQPNGSTFNPRKVFDAFLSKIIAAKEEVISLTKQRDELFPLLMNGQVSVNYDLSPC